MPSPHTWGHNHCHQVRLTPYCDYKIYVHSRILHLVLLFKQLKQNPTLADLSLTQHNHSLFSSSFKFQFVTRYSIMCYPQSLTLEWEIASWDRWQTQILKYEGTWKETKNATKLPKGVFKHHISGLGRVGDLTPITDTLGGWGDNDADIILEYVFSSK